MNQAVRVVALLQAREGRAAEVERLLACVQPSRAEDGCLSYVLHRSLDEAGRFVFVERWADRDAIERHRRMPHYRAMADAVADLLAGPPGVPPRGTASGQPVSGRSGTYKTP